MAILKVVLAMVLKANLISVDNIKYLPFCRFYRIFEMAYLRLLRCIVRLCAFHFRRLGRTRKWGNFGELQEWPTSFVATGSFWYIISTFQTGSKNGYRSGSEKRATFELNLSTQRGLATHFHVRKLTYPLSSPHKTFSFPLLTIAVLGQMDRGCRTDTPHSI
jgi:hypothetical protein